MSRAIRLAAKAVLLMVAIAAGILSLLASCAPERHPALARKQAPAYERHMPGREWRG